MRSSSRRKRRLRGFWTVAIIAAIALSGLAAWSRFEPGCLRVTANNDPLLLNVQTLKEGVAQKYCIKTSNDRLVRFVLARGLDGKIRVVFDACQVCFRNNLGFKLAGHQVVCRLCGNRYLVDSIDKGEASCAPMTVRFEERGGLIKIQRSDLKRGERFFPPNFAGAEALESVRSWFGRLVYGQNDHFEML